jgi:hypothetical protein
MLVAMTFNGGIILVLIFSMFLANFGFSVLGDRLYIKARMENSESSRQGKGAGGIGDSTE